MAVRIENLRLGDEAEVMALFVHYGKVPCLRVVEGAHHLLHAVRVVQAGGEGGHQFAHGEPMVQFLAEHDVAYVVQYDNAEQYAGLVGYGEDVASGGGDGFHQFAQVHFGADGDEVFSTTFSIFMSVSTALSLWWVMSSPFLARRME